MPNFDSCLGDVFEPGNIGSESGSVTVDEYIGFLLTAEGERIMLTTTTPPPGAVLGGGSYLIGFALLSGDQ